MADPHRSRSLQRARGFCYTLNNYTSDEVLALRNLNNSQVRYHIFGRETGSEGTPHLQGFIYFNTARRFRPTLRRLPERVHLEVMRGSPEQAAQYCKKDGDFEEFGTCPRSGSTSGYDELLTKLREEFSGNVTDFLLAQPEVTARHFRWLDRVGPFLAKPRSTKTKVLWFYGRSGTGKSYTARQLFPDAYFKCMEEDFWEGYHGQSCVVLEDLRPSHIPFTTLLRLFDSAPLQVKVKGSSAQFVSTTIVVTTPLLPNQLFHQTATLEDIFQLERRIDELREFTEVYAPAIPQWLRERDGLP